MNEESKTRILWVDVAKGLGVFFVILGHLWYDCSPQIVNKAIYAFHMPMFFILSGFVFGVSEKYRSFSAFVSEKAKRLLAPAILYIFIYALIYIPRSWGELGLRSTIIRALYLKGECLFNYPCWFFITLFEIYVLMYLIRIQRMNLKAKAAVMLAFALIGYAVYTYRLIPYFGIDRAIISSCFFVAGTVIKDIYDKNAITKAGHFSVFFVSLFMFLFFGIFVNDKVSFYGRNLGHYFPFLLSGLFGSIIFFYICRCISDNKISRYCRITADNSVFIVGTHYIAASLFRTLGRVSGMSYTWYFSLLAVIYTILLVGIYRRVCRILDARVPILTGKRKA